jgi:hypothetical protein
VGRLENIVNRNRELQRRGLRKLLLTIGIVLAIFVIAILMLFTDWGQPNLPPKQAPSQVHDVYIGKPHTNGSATK